MVNALKTNFQENANDARRSRVNVPGRYKKGSASVRLSP